MEQKPEHSYAALMPDTVLLALEGLGLRCDGRLLALNSYENRVYQVGIEEGAPIVAKFYRSGRWTDAAILEEHAFVRDLAEREIPVVAALEWQGKTLHHAEGFRFAVFPRQGGRAPELDDPDTLEWMGRFMGRIHAVGALRDFEHRPTLDIESFGVQPREYLLAHGFIPQDILAATVHAIRAALAGLQGGPKAPLAGPAELASAIRSTAYLALDARLAGWRDNGGGYQIWISDGHDIYTGYHHLSSIGVDVGEHVKRGQRIGAVGMTGNATGPHCHFMVTIGRIWDGGRAVDPRRYL